MCLVEALHVYPWAYVWGGGGLRGCSPLPRIFKMAFFFAQKVSYIFGQVLEKIFRQETSAPPNETGPIRLCVYLECVQVSNKHLTNRSHSTFPYFFAKILPYQGCYHFITVPQTTVNMQATLSLDMQMLCACLFILNIFLELCHQFYVIGR